MDRRVEKTKKAVFNAFIDLLKKKDFENISITEIAGTADINRVTIYKHYIDKYDILDQCIDYCIDPFLKDCNRNAVYEVTYHAFEYLYQNRIALNLLLKAAGAGVLHEKFATSFMERAYLHDFVQGENELYTAIKTQFFVSAVAGIFEWWLTASETYTVNDACNTLFSVMKEIFPDYKIS